MDGFYVCKIQKLSDKIKGENEPSQDSGENEKTAENEEKLEGGVEGKTKQKGKEMGKIKNATEEEVQD
jgi:hypothetical protein